MLTTKQFIGFIFFSALIFINASSFHIYSHQENDSLVEDCSLCDLATEQETEAFIPSDDNIVGPPYVQVAYEANITKAQLPATPICWRILSRPPPRA